MAMRRSTAFVEPPRAASVHGGGVAGANKYSDHQLRSPDQTEHSAPAFATFACSRFIPSPSDDSCGAQLFSHLAASDGLIDIPRNVPSRMDLAPESFVGIWCAESEIEAGYYLIRAVASFRKTIISIRVRLTPSHLRSYSPPHCHYNELKAHH